MDKSIGEEIRELRLKADFTLRSFAKEIEVSPAHLSDIEHGRRLPSEALLVKIVNVLSRVGASMKRFKELDTRLDPETKKWAEKTPGAQQILRVSKDSGKTVHEILQILQESFNKSVKQKDSDEN